MLVNPELSVIIFGLLASASWGAGDFSGGLATKRLSVVSVMVVAHVLGLAILLALALITREPLLDWRGVLGGGLAGIAGMIGLAALYRGLAVGNMSVVASVAAVLAALIPAAFSIFTEGPPRTNRIIGFGLAFLSVALTSYSHGAARKTSGVGLAVIAGLGFSAFYILLDQVGTQGVFWPLVVVRVASTTTMLVILLTRRTEFPQDQKGWVIASLSGLFDASGNIFYVLATQAGRLDVAAVLSSLYPAMTILLARFILNERLNRKQAFGVLVALAAIGLISAGSI